MLKISYKLMEPYRAKKRKKPVRHGYCQLCGSKLSDAKSIELGIGRGCMGKHVAIVLEIVPDDLPNNACTRPPSTVPQYDTGHPNPMFVHHESRTNGGG